MSSRRFPLNFKSRVWPIFRVRRWMKMATRRSLLQNDSSSPSHANDPGRDLFEACRNGDLNKVKKLVNHHNVNAKDTAGRKSSPLHFAAGMNDVKHCFVLMIWCLLFIWKFWRHVYKTVVISFLRLLQRMIETSNVYQMSSPIALIFIHSVFFKPWCCSF